MITLLQRSLLRLNAHDDLLIIPGDTNGAGMSNEFHTGNRLASAIQKFAASSQHPTACI